MISVIMPAYNCSRYLREAVESAVTQTFSDLEILIIEDCSTDKTLELALALEEEYPPVQVIRNSKNLGAAASRNRGIDLSKGEWIAFLDGDDSWLPEKLERQIQLLEKTGAALCYTAYSFINAQSNAIRRTYQVPDRTTYKGLLKENVIGLSTALIHREIIGDIRMRGEFAHEDYVFWLELLKKGCQTAGLNEPLTRYRISESNRSGDKKKAARGRWDIYRRFLRLGRVHSAYLFCQYAAKGIQKHPSLKLDTIRDLD